MFENDNGFSNDGLDGCGDERKGKAGESVQKA
jgi:hypothetical protein